MSRSHAILALVVVLAAVVFGWNTRRGPAAEEAPKGVAKWEYKIMPFTNVTTTTGIDEEKTAKANEKVLNDLAANGWELDRDHGFYLILRRPKR